jgi:hypothetical protein
VNFAVALRRKHCYLCPVGDGHKDLGQPKNNTAKKDKPAAEPIVVPIVLRMSDFDHKALLEEWIATRAFRDNCLPQVSMPLWKLWYTYN